MLAFSIRPFDGPVFDDFIPNADRLFSLFFGEQAPAPQPTVVESAEAYTGNVDLPGVRREDLQVTLTKRQLRIVGKRQSQSFDHSWRIPTDVDADRVTAKLADGVLHLTLPKVQKTLDTRAITVT